MVRTTSWRLLLSACCLCAARAPADAQTVNPYDGDGAAVRAGAALFANRCAECHGGDARGFSGPDLTLLWELGTDDGFVFETIRDGVPGSTMPASSAPEHEIWAIVAYVKSLGTVRGERYDRGDAERGRAVFEASCARCHHVGGQGGRLGPDLSRVTSTRSREALVGSIRSPDAAVAAGYRAVTLVTGDGTRLRGAVKGEDAFSIQVMHPDERIQGYRKADLADLVHEERSLMPRFGPDRLSDGEIEDVLRYLDSARDARPARR